MSAHRALSGPRDAGLVFIDALLRTAPIVRRLRGRYTWSCIGRLRRGAVSSFSARAEALEVPEQARLEDSWFLLLGGGIALADSAVEASGALQSVRSTWSERPPRIIVPCHFGE